MRISVQHIIKLKLELSTEDLNGWEGTGRASWEREVTGRYTQREARFLFVGEQRWRRPA